MATEPEKRWQENVGARGHSCGDVKKRRAPLWWLRRLGRAESKKLKAQSSWDRTMGFCDQDESKRGGRKGQTRGQQGSALRDQGLGPSWGTK